jgi:hypothetical protein
MRQLLDEKWNGLQHLRVSGVDGGAGGSDSDFDSGAVGKATDENDDDS